MLEPCPDLSVGRPRTLSVGSLAALVVGEGCPHRQHQRRSVTSFPDGDEEKHGNKRVREEKDEERSRRNVGDEEKDADAIATISLHGRRAGRIIKRRESCRLRESRTHRIGPMAFFYGWSSIMGGDGGGAPATAIRTNYHPSSDRQSGANALH